MERFFDDVLFTLVVRFRQLRCSFDSFEPFPLKKVGLGRRSVLVAQQMPDDDRFGTEEEKFLFDVEQHCHRVEFRVFKTRIFFKEIQLQRNMLAQFFKQLFFYILK